MTYADLQLSTFNELINCSPSGLHATMILDHETSFNIITELFSVLRRQSICRFFFFEGGGGGGGGMMLNRQGNK